MHDLLLRALLISCPVLPELDGIQIFYRRNAFFNSYLNQTRYITSCDNEEPVVYERAVWEQFQESKNNFFC